MSTKRLTRDELWNGMCCLWAHKPRGGYGYVIMLQAQIVNVCKEKALISVSRRDGSKKQVLVSISSLYTWNDPSDSKPRLGYYPNDYPESEAQR